MISRFKKIKKKKDLPLSQEQFLAEHNRLSPVDLRATFALLTRFKETKSSLFKNDNWSMEKIRKPLIAWMMFSAVEEHK